MPQIDRREELLPGEQSVHCLYIRERIIIRNGEAVKLPIIDAHPPFDGAIDGLLRYE